MLENEYDDKGFELKYAPRQCRYFCLGECTLTGGSGQEMKSCHTDYPECERSERK